MAQSVAGLTDRHDVAVLYMRGVGDDDMPEDLRAACAYVEAVPRRERQRGLRRRLTQVRRAVRLVTGVPRWVDRWDVPAFGDHMVRCVRDWQPDIIQAEMHAMAQFLPRLGPCSVPRVLVEHEPGTSTARERLDEARSWSRVIAWLELRAWQKYERRIARDIDVVVVFTERDRDALRESSSQTPIEVIPLAMDVPERPLDPQGDGNTVVFVGNYMHPPNVDAAVWLAQSIFPGIHTARSSARLMLVGQGPPLTVRQLASPEITVTGRVRDILSVIDRASVVVAPLRRGGGMRVKVLDALAVGKAIVATSLAVEGLDVVDGDHLLVKDDERSFAEAVTWLLDNPEDRKELAVRARGWAEEHLRWESSLDAYDRLYSSLLARSRVGS